MLVVLDKSSCKINVLCKLNMQYSKVLIYLMHVVMHLIYLLSKDLILGINKIAHLQFVNCSSHLSLQHCLLKKNDKKLNIINIIIINVLST